jgi:hypothetical protein
VDRMGTETLIGFGDVLVALLAYAVHAGDLLSKLDSLPEGAESNGCAGGRLSPSC